MPTAQTIKQPSIISSTSGECSSSPTVRASAQNDAKLLTEAFLPRHILVDYIFAYLDLHSLVVLSGCSRTLHTVVFKQTPKDRWEVIHLCGGRHCSINDEQLSTFLRNIDAVVNTRVLSLVGCPSLTGHGIEPLTGSSVLEDIDLRVSGSLPLTGQLGKRQGETSIDDLFVTRVLRTMIPISAGENIAPFALRRAAFRPKIIASVESYDSEIVRFSSYFDSCKRNFAVQSEAKYCSKQGDCFDTSGKNVHGKCSKCMDIFCLLCCSGKEFVKCSLCRELLCPTCTKGRSIKCVICDSSYCNSCAMPPKCSMCEVHKCQWCSNIYECGGCGKQSCANHGAESCMGCDKSYCNDCQEALEFCIVCNEYYCSDSCHDQMH